MKSLKDKVFFIILIAIVLVALLKYSVAHPGVDDIDPRLLVCSKNLEKSAVIGQEGGEVVLPPVRLFVPSGALENNIRIILQRHPEDKQSPEKCSYLDRYTARPFLLKVNAESPFLLEWIADISLTVQPESDKSKEVYVCPRVSWTEDAGLSACYYAAGLPKSFVAELSDEKGRVSIWAYHSRLLGIYSGCNRFEIDIKKDNKKKILFLTDRLAHFKLNIPEWVLNNKERKNRENAGGIILASKEEKCFYVPPSLRRMPILYKNDEVYWQKSCRSNSDCKYNEFCERREGRCNEIGLCINRECTPKYWQKYYAVCGCDGKTYNTICDARRKGVSIRTRHPCK